MNGELDTYRRIVRLEVCIEFEVVRFGGDEHLVGVAVLNGERNRACQKFRV